MGLWAFFKNYLKCKKCELRDEQLVRLQQLHDIHRADFLDQIHYLRQQLPTPTVQQVNSEPEVDQELVPVRGHKTARLILAELSRKPGNNLAEKQAQFKKEEEDASRIS